VSLTYFQSLGPEEFGFDGRVPAKRSAGPNVNLSGLLARLDRDGHELCGLTTYIEDRVAPFCDAKPSSVSHLRQIFDKAASSDNGTTLTRYPFQQAVVLDRKQQPTECLPWSVPLPNAVNLEADVFPRGALRSVRAALSGLGINYDHATHSLYPVFREAMAGTNRPISGSFLMLNAYLLLVQWVLRMEAKATVIPLHQFPQQHRQESLRGDFLEFLKEMRTHHDRWCKTGWWDALDHVKRLPGRDETAEESYTYRLISVWSKNQLTGRK